MAPMTAMPTRKVTCNLARPAATKTNRVVAGARKAHGKTQQVATAAGVSVAVGTTVLAQSAHAANEVAEVAATFNLADSQVFGAIFISLIAGILATRLGAELYK